jgi:hypothetical protein
MSKTQTFSLSICKQSFSTFCAADEQAKDLKECLLRISPSSETTDKKDSLAWLTEASMPLAAPY